MENETKHIWAHMLDFRSRALRALWHKWAALWGASLQNGRKVEVLKFSSKKMLLLIFTSGFRWRAQKN